jgi:hypothetical protein
MRCSRAWLVASLLLGVASVMAAPAELRTLDARRMHLRSGTNAEWEEFAASQPFGRRLDVAFESRRNATEQTLLLWQDEVRQDWRVELNGRRLGSLHLMEAPLDFALRIPVGALRDGSNLLSILPPRENDDIRIGNIRLVTERLEAALDQAGVDVEVTDLDSHTPLPCRLTITTTNGTLAALITPTNQFVAARPGVVYTGNGRATVRLAAGSYVISATRGFEYGLAVTNLTLAQGQRRTVQLQLRREVATPGLVSSDTHVHTFTHSRHGDAKIEERAITLAGEGIELPILTDHDVAVDLQPAAQATRTQAHFTSVIGDEVTTRVGHFNIFPVKPGASLPSNRETNWTTLFDSFRATPGVQVVVFNHPRNTHTGFQPFARTNFNRVTGEARWPFDFRFDAMELVNSSAQQSDWTSVLQDWFALWNAGHLVTAVGSSDGHDVSRYIVGQGRTYLEGDDTKLDSLDVQAAARSLKEGRAYVSMGLLPIVTVNDLFRVGDFATNLSSTISVKVEVRAPSWIECQRVELFANGVRIAETNWVSSKQPRLTGVAASVEWKIPRPKHDVALVVVATGPGATAPHWPIPKPYQPSSPSWVGRVIGVANPIRLDGDGNGRFSTARDYAATLAGEFNDAGRLVRSLNNFDEAVAIQAAALARQKGLDLNSPEWKNAVAAHPSIQRAFTKVLDEER